MMNKRPNFLNLMFDLDLSQIINVILVCKELLVIPRSVLNVERHVPEELPWYLHCPQPYVECIHRPERKTLNNYKIGRKQEICNKGI